MSQKLISIIIPCYNVEAWLPRCFYSLQQQTIGLERLELIFLDDASTDHTWDTLRAIEDSCPDSVLVVHCDRNKGLGAMRNLGLQYATCPYIAFLDSDDWVEADMYEKMYEKIKKFDCDFVRCKYIRDFGESGFSPEDQDTGKEDRLLLIDTIEKRKAFLLTDSAGSTAWDKLIKKKFLVENELYFPEGIAYEDHPWVSLLYLYATHVYVLEKRLYHYYVNENSIVLKKNQEYHHDFLISGLIKWNEWEKRGFLRLYRSELECNFLLDTYLGYLKVLFLRFSAIPYSHFLSLREEVLDRIPEPINNPYISTCFTDLNRILLDLLFIRVTEKELNEVALTAKSFWLSVAVFTATHVAFHPPSDPTYIPLHVGRAGSEDLGYPGDDTGDNISLINCYYGELTGLYWIWKNYQIADYVGLCHYRRYFLNERHEIMTKADYLRVFAAYDLILSKPVYSEKTYYEVWQEAHNIHDLLTVGETIKKLTPEYFPAFEEVLSSHYLYCGNLFVASKPVFNRYAEWLFTILKAASQMIDTTGYDSYHRRVYGFLSEQLLFVWAKVSGLPYYECEVGFTQEKAETVELKRELSLLLQQGKWKEAKALFRERAEKRPDILLPGSDFSQELPVIWQILNVCEKESFSGSRSFLSYSRDVDRLILHFRRSTEILEHMKNRQFTPEDAHYLRKTGISRHALQAMIDSMPSLQNIRLAEWLY